MKARRDNKNLKIISATAVSIFSLLAVFMGTIAWFSANRLVNGDNKNINVLTPSGIFKQLTFHKLVSNPYDDELYSFNQTPVGTLVCNDWVKKTVKYTPTDESIETVQMDRYSILEHRHPMLLLIELDKAYDISNFNITLSAYTDTIGFVGDRSLKEAESLVLNTTSNPLSSIVHFATYGYTQNALNATKGTYSSTSVYQFPKPIEENKSEDIEGDYKAFTDFEVSDENNEIIEIDFHKQFDFYVSNEDTSRNVKTNTDTTTEIKYLPIIMDYYDSALEHIYNTYLGESILEQDLSYTWDWELKL